MRGIAYSVVVLVLAGGLGMVHADEPTPGPSPEQQTAPQEQAAGQEPAATQPTISRSGPEPAPAIAPFDAEQAKQHQEAWAKHLGVPVEVTNSIGMKLVLIPPGEFMMGSSPEAIVDSAGHEMSERPPLRVRIMKPFYLGLHEVTRDTFRQFVEDQPYRTEGERDGQGSYGFTGERWEMKPEWSWQHPGFPQNGQHPVVHVSWNDAVAFCGWLSTKEGRTYRLPTEAQWEYACRTGTTTPWVSGRNPDDVTLVANIADSTLHGTFELLWAVSTSDGYVFTSPVGQFSANPFGLRDMYGNVAEWCQDWFDAAYYAHSPSDDPVGPPGGSFRVVRGGSWHNHAAFARSALRRRFAPFYRDSGTGFRVALDVATKVEPLKEGK